mgnify:CR=1 FL=1
MLNLQTIVEELGIKCYGQAWVIVTSQQNIDDITNVNIKNIVIIKNIAYNNVLPPIVEEIPIPCV